MKKFLVLLSLLVSNLMVSQQVFPFGVDTMVGLYQKLRPKQLFTEDEITIDDNFHIKNHIGSPLLLPKWARAEVLFNDGKLYTIPNVNYDALDDLFVIYLKHYTKEFDDIASKDFPVIALTRQNLIAIALISDEKKTMRFVKVSPGRFINKPKTEFFEYFSLQPKDAFILKSIYKKIKKNYLKDMAFSDSPDDFEFKTYSIYYIKNKAKLFVPVRLGKKSVLKAINDPGAEKALKKYIKANHLNMRTPQDVQKLLAYYFKELHQ